METLCITLLFGGLAIFLLYKYLTSGSQKLPPGPRGLSALLSVLKAFRDGSLHKQANVWYDQYGDIVLCRTVLGDLCFLNSARLVKEMYASKERELVTNDRPRMFSAWFVFGFNDVIFSDSSMSLDWPRRRRMFHYAIKFYGDGVERFESTVQTELQRLTSRIEARAGEEIDMENWLSYSLLCVLTILVITSSSSSSSSSSSLSSSYHESLRPSGYNGSFDLPTRPTRVRAASPCYQYCICFHSSTIFVKEIKKKSSDLDHARHD